MTDNFFIIACYLSWEPEPCIEISRAGAGVVLLPGPISVIPDMCEINYFTNSPPGPGIGMIYVNAFYFLLCYSCFLFSHPICFTIVFNMDIYSRSLFDFLYPPANCVCGRVYCFHVVRPSERKCVRDVLFP